MSIDYGSSRVYHNVSTVLVRLRYAFTPGQVHHGGGTVNVVAP